MEPAGRTTWRLGVAALLALALLAAGCAHEGTTARSEDASGSGPPSEAPAEPTPSSPATMVVEPTRLPPGIGLSFIQLRIDESTRRAQVRVINGTERTLHVREVGVDWAGYPLRLQPAAYDVFSQQIVDLRYLLPPAVCTPAAGRAPMRGVAVTSRGRVSGPMGEDGVRFLTRLWSAECDGRRLDAAVGLSYGDVWRETGSGATALLHGTLELDRPGPDASTPVRVTQVEGSVLYDLAMAPGRRTLSAGRRHVSVPIVVRSGGRCDPHSRGQSTQTFLFRAYLSVGGAPEISRILSPTKPQQRRLLRFLDDACAETSDGG